LEGPTIGIVSPMMAGHYFGVLISVVNRAVSAAGGRVVAVSSTVSFGSGYHSEEVIQHLPHFGWECIDGFVTIANAVSVDYLEALGRAGKPFVSLGQEEPSFSYPAVLSDNGGGVRRAVEHLVGHGHERIAFAGALSLFDVHERYAAYRESLRAHGLAIDPELVYDVYDNNEFGGHQAGDRMLATGLRSTAVVAATDLNAVGIITTLKAAGCVLPADQAIVGFDDLPSSASLCPTLSSISQNLEEMGNLAAELIMRMAGGQTVRPGRYVVEGSFLARESCGCTDDALVEDEPGGEPGDPAARLMATLRKVQDGVSGPFPAQKVAALAAVIETAMVRAALRDLSSPEQVELSLASRELYCLQRSQATADAILHFARRVRAQLTTTADSGGTGRRLDAAVTAVQLSLGKAVVGESTDAYYELRRAIREVHEISLALLRSHESDPRSLGWLAETKATAGMLALWKGLPPGPRGCADDGGAGPAEWLTELEIAGTFQPHGGHIPASTDAYGVEHFPPAEFLAAAGQGNVVLLFPVIGGERAWGVLSVAVPVDLGFIGQDTYFQWAALLGEALDYQHVAQAVREKEERYALVVQAANDGIWDWDLDQGTVYYSSRWSEMLGANGALAANPEEWLDRVHPDDRAALGGQLAALKRGEQPSVFLEHRIKSGEGEYIWVLCRVLSVPGGGSPAKRIVGSLTDVTDRHQLEERLRHQALHDALTGLANRVLFLDRLAQGIVAGARDPARAYAVLWLDLDGFKALNDSFGHQMGDKLLVQVGERLKAHLREPDTAARFGGDEFAVLLLNVPDQAAVKIVAQRLVDHLGAIQEVDGNRIRVTASIGVAMSTLGYERAEDVLRAADIAMYAAKSSGGGTYAIFDPAVHATAIPRPEPEPATAISRLEPEPATAISRLEPEPDVQGPIAPAPPVHGKGVIRSSRRPTGLSRPSRAR
jgi:diguanylate cyclase (GGDEF)-like protein/PAS domain S-box-containing protein